MIIDINCDVGEGVGNENYLLPFISSCNIACGGHAGDANTINEVIELAKKYHVKVGAHPSFPDRENFGRKVINIPPNKLRKSLEDQILLVKESLMNFDLSMHHIKVHGALYNLAAVDEKTAQVVVDTVLECCPEVYLYVPDQSVISKIAKGRGVQIKYEAFGDRNYNENLTLVSRLHESALITQKEEVFSHILAVLNTGKVKTITGKEIPLLADTFCIHGDHKNANTLVKYLFDEFKAIKVEVAKS